MVLLTMTPTIVAGLRLWESLFPDEPLRCEEGEPSLSDAVSGNPISHGQIIDLWKKLKTQQGSHATYSLEKLLLGSRVYFPPPPPKPEPSDEYKALMARLRREEEARAYERMVRPPPATETYSQMFPSLAQSFAAANRPHSKADMGDDDVTSNEVHRQMMLILNFALSIIGAGVTLWVLGRWWSTTARVFLALGGSIVVGVAEVGVYYFYIWHLMDASKREKTFKERKEVVQTWVLEKSHETNLATKPAASAPAPGDAAAVRRRRKT